jgi:hypothetical protein
MDDNQAAAEHAAEPVAERAAQTDEERPTATDTARRAIQVARALSPPMQRALKLAWKSNEGAVVLDYVCVRMNTRNALRARGLARGAALTDFGRIVRAVLLTSAEDVLAYAQRRERAEPATGCYALDPAAGTRHGEECPARRGVADVGYLHWPDGGHAPRRRFAAPPSC